MTATESEMTVLANRIVNAAETGDLEPIRPFFHPQCVIWHNFDRVEKTIAETVPSYAVMCKPGTVRILNIKRHFFDGGWVEQHQTRAESPSGLEWSMDSCTVFLLSEGRVVRIDEYFDPSQVPQFS